MKTLLKLVIISTFLLGVSGISSAQHQWELLGPIDFNAVQKLSDGKILICTSSGSIYFSTDNGDSWSRHLINPQRGYYCMKFFDDTHGIIGATGQPNFAGNVEITSDGGNTWTESIAGSTYIKSVAYPSIDTAYVCADHGCFRSTDRGKTWDSLPIPTSIAFIKIIFTDASHGFLAGGEGILYRTITAGMTWEKVLLPSSITNISAMDANAQGKIVVAIAPRIATSIDNGAHWKVSDFSGRDSLTLPIQMVKIMSDNKIVAFLSGTYRLFSSDFGDTWIPFRLLQKDRDVNPVISFNPGTLWKDIYVDNNGEGLATGTFGTIYKVRNFGNNTSEVSSELQHHCGISIGTFPFALGDVFLEALPEKTNIIRSFAMPRKAPLSISNDGGTSWFSRNKPLHTFFALHSTAINEASLFGPLISRTTDEGIHWTTDSINNPPEFLPSGRFYGFRALPNGDLLFVSDSVMYTSSDEGKTFSIAAKYYETVPRDAKRKILLSSILPMYYSPGTDTIVLEVSTSDSMFIYHPGDFGYTAGVTYNLVGSTDGGKHWTKRFVFPDSLALIGIAFLDANRGVALFHDTITLPDHFDQTTKIPNQTWQTTDGGNHWDIMEGISARIRFRDVKFNRNGSVGVILGTYGDMWVTLDSGKTWKADSLLYLVDLLKQNAQSSKVFFPDDTTVLITSDIGIWRKTFPTAKASAVTIGSVSNPYLYISAYPSPTNGKVIHCTVYGLYSVQPASVSFTMMDVLGREVMDITSMVRNSSNGAYSTFDIPTASLSAGVYYLILSTSNGGTTQNVVIVK